MIDAPLLRTGNRQMPFEFSRVLAARLLILVAVLCAPSIRQVVPNELSSSTGAVPGAFYGFIGGAVGDVNADGVIDYGIRHNVTIMGGQSTQNASIYSGADNSLIHSYAYLAFANSPTVITGVGDVNSDGFGDFLIGSGRHAQAKGRAHVYSGLDGSLIYNLFGLTVSAHFGETACGIGDINFDGVDDFAVGAPSTSNTSLNTFRPGSVFIYSGIDGTLIRTLIGDHPRSLFGTSVCRLDDIDGDGISEIAIGAPETGVTAIYQGLVRVYSGGTGAVLYSLFGESGSYRMGVSIAPLNDVDQDNVDDFVISEPQRWVGNESVGSVHTISGATGQKIYSVDGDLHIGRFGWRVETVGDIDGDGFDDVIASGRASSIDSNALSQSSLLSGFNGTRIAVFDQMTVGDRPIGLAAGLGDLDGDGFGEFMIGYPLNDTAGNDAGRVVIYQGFSSTITAQPMAALAFHIFGTPQDLAGSSVRLIRDTNGNGYDDLLIGRPEAKNAQTAEVGIVRLVDGRTQATLFELMGEPAFSKFGTSLSTLGDLNADGIDDWVGGAPEFTLNGFQIGAAYVRSGADGSSIHTFLGGNTLDQFGEAVGNAGDINGDGLVDIIVGAPGADPNGGESGEVKILSGFDGSLLRIHSGSMPNENFGQSVCGFGDLNNDGYAEYAVGAPGDSTNGQDAGRVQVFSGFDGTILWQKSGSNSERFGTAIDASGDTNNDGIRDLVVGAPGLPQPIGALASHVELLSGSDGGLLLSHVESASQRLGASVEIMGDFDGDGFDDVIIGGPGSSTSKGIVNVISGRNGATLMTRSSTVDGTQFGASVSGRGDFNNDGFADLTIGAPRKEAPNVDLGTVFAYHAPRTPVLHYKSKLGTSELQLFYTGTGDNPYAATGDYHCSGATPGGFGIFAVSLFRVDVTYSPTFPLLISNLPEHLVGQGSFGFDLSGEMTATNLSRQYPSIAGTNLYMQCFEISPFFRASDGFRLLVTH